MPRIYFKTADQYVEFAEGEEVNILRMAIREDCDVPWQCASGNCGTDRVVVEEGAENANGPGWANCSMRATGWPARPTPEAT